MSASLPPLRADAFEPENPVTQCRVWASGLIATLFIALASALLPGSMPASQMVGSAFNPATTLVALSRDENEHDALAALHDGGERPSLTGGDDAPPEAAPVAFPFIAPPHRAPTPAPLATPQLARTPFVRPGSGPRAPPIAG